MSRSLRSAAFYTVPALSASAGVAVLGLSRLRVACSVLRGEVVLHDN
jgi:hypothetical protein